MNRASALLHRMSKFVICEIVLTKRRRNRQVKHNLPSIYVSGTRTSPCSCRICVRHQNAVIVWLLWRSVRGFIYLFVFYLSNENIKIKKSKCCNGVSCASKQEATVNLGEDDRQCRQTIYHRMRVCNCTRTKCAKWRLNRSRVAAFT